MRPALHATPLVLALVAAPTLALAQTTTPPTTTSTSVPSGWIVTRQNSPRAFENGGVVPAPGTTSTTSVPVSIGLRDCECGEIWHITGPLRQPVISGTMTAEFWVGTTADSCTTAVGRGQSTVAGTAPTCVRIGYAPIASGIGVGNPSFAIDVPAGFLVNPNTGACDNSSTVDQGATSGSLYFNVVYLPSPDNATVDSFAYNFDYQPPSAATGVMAQAQEASALITWTQGTSSVDGGAAVVDPDVASGGGWYVVAWPPPAALPGSFQDAGAVCDGPGESDANVDVQDDIVDESLLDDVQDESLVSEAGTTEAGFDGGIDAGFDASTSESGTPGDGASTAMCGSPPTNIDINNDAQFRQIAATDLIHYGAMTSVTVNNLQNGVQYQFAVVTQDGSGNRVMSDWTPCVTPQPVTDFYQHYTGSGGRAQAGTFCSTRPGPVHERPWTLAALAGALVALVARRRSRRDGSGR